MSSGQPFDILRRRRSRRDERPSVKAVSLRTQLLLVVALVEPYSVGMGLSHWVQAVAQERLEHAFRQDLAILANSLVEAHGTRLRTESAAGKGSEFSFRLPVWLSGPEPQGS